MNKTMNQLKDGIETIALAGILLVSLFWLLTHDGCAHPIGNTIATLAYVASGVMLATPWLMGKLMPYLTEDGDDDE